MFKLNKRPKNNSREIESAINAIAERYHVHDVCIQMVRRCGIETWIVKHDGEEIASHLSEMYAAAHAARMRKLLNAG